MNHTNVKIVLDTRRLKTDNSYPIILRLCHHGKSMSIRTGISIPQKYWDSNLCAIKKGYKGFESITRVNNLLLKKKLDAFSVINCLKDKAELESISITELKERIVRPKGKISFFKFTEQVIDELKRSNRIGSANSYRAVLNVVKVFRNGKDFSFDELNHAFLKNLEIHHLSKGNTVNGLAVYLKTIRAIFNKATKLGYADKESYPFDNYKIRLTPTRKRALNLESIRKIENLEVPTNQKLFLYKNIFLMSFYMMGTSFADLAHLKLNNIKDGRIFYIRQRTKRPYDIKINTQLAGILAHYTSDKQDNNYILPIIKEGDLIKKHKEVIWARQRYNKGLKKIAKLAGIEENITSYVARHTFASVADSLEIPVTAISQMLGHEKLSTTQVYLAGVNKSIIDKYNDKIINS